MGATCLAIRYGRIASAGATPPMASKSNGFLLTPLLFGLALLACLLDALKHLLGFTMVHRSSTVSGARVAILATAERARGDAVRVHHVPTVVAALLVTESVETMNRPIWLRQPVERTEGILQNVAEQNHAIYCSPSTKRFLFGDRIKGRYSPLGQVSADRPLCICEGWATGATLHQVGDKSVAGDDDRGIDNKPVRSAANAAAVAVGGQLAFPDWPNAPTYLTDFNDLDNWKRCHE